MQHPQLTPDIIHDLIIEPLPTLDICLKHQLSVDQLHALVTSEQFKQLAEQLTDIDQARAPFTRARMLRVLERIAQLEPQSPTHTETIRKAAAQLLRLTEPREHNAQTQDESEPQPQDPRSTQNNHEETAHTPGRDAAAHTDPPQSDAPPPHEHTRQLDKESIAPPSTSQRQQSTRRKNKSRKRKR